MSIEFGGNVVNHVKAIFVNELGKYCILKFSLFSKSLASIRYMATCSTVDSLVSPKNFVNLGTLQPLGNSACKIKFVNGDV